MPAKTQTKPSQKIEKPTIKHQQSNKVNKHTIIDKTLKLLSLSQKLIPLKKPNFGSEIGAVLYQRGLKKFIGP